MGSILCLETSSRVCSVAIGCDGQILACNESEKENAHSSALTALVDRSLQQAGTGLSGIDAIAISMGPGSYTGLRIGVATAKGFCYSLDKPLISVPTLKSLALGIREYLEIKSPSNQFIPDYPVRESKDFALNTYLICPMLDARRMEVYCAVYDQSLNEIFPVSAQIINSGSFSELLGKNRLVFAGEGALKCKPFLDNNPNSFFPDNFKLSARFLYPLADEKFSRHEYENLAYFEPFYLKDFIAGKPRVKGLKD
jgi:tRNA threonylcarbamoyladenosine biosynthesis protein TsaB